MSTKEVPCILPPCKELIDAVERLRSMEEESPGTRFEDILRQFEELRQRAQASAYPPPQDPAPQVPQKTGKFLNCGPDDFQRGDVNGVMQAMGRERASAQSVANVSDAPRNNPRTRSRARGQSSDYIPHNAGYILPVPPPHFEDKTVEVISQSTITHLRRYGRKTHDDCPVGCWRLNFPRHLDHLENMINSTPHGGPFRHFVAYCTLGHDIHRNIPQMVDCLPGIPKKPIEIPFERTLRGKDTKGAPGIPFLEVLYKWDNLVDHDALVSKIISEKLESPDMPNYIQLYIPVNSNERPKHYHAVKLKCYAHSITWYELAIHIVKGVMENMERGKDTLVFGSDGKVYPIRTILHGRLVALLTLDKTIWWPHFSTATIEPEDGRPAPSRLNRAE